MKNKKHLTIPLSLLFVISPLNAMMHKADSPSPRSTISENAPLSAAPISELIGKIELLKDQLEATTDNTKKQLLQIQYRLLKLLHFHPDEVGELSALSEEDQKPLLEAAASALSDYYRVVLTKVPNHRVREFKNAIEGKLEDRPNRSAHIRRAAMIFCNLDLPEAVSESFEAIFMTQVYGDNFGNIEKVLSYEYGLSDGAVLMLLINKGLSKGDGAQVFCYINNLSSYLEAVLSTPICMWIREGGLWAHDETISSIKPASSDEANCQGLFHCENSEKFKKSLEALSTPLTEEADKKLEKLYADVMYKSIEKLKDLAIAQEALGDLTLEDLRYLLVAYAKDTIEDYFTLMMTEQKSEKREITASTIPGLVIDAHKELFNVATATKKRHYTLPFNRGANLGG